jgi:hypothetical protein
MKRNIFQYALQNEDHGPTGSLKSEDTASSKLRPEENNTSPGAGLDTDNEGERAGKATPEMDADSSTPGTGDTEMDADSSTPGTGDMSGRAGGGGDSGPVTGG